MCKTSSAIVRHRPPRLFTWKTSSAIVRLSVCRSVCLRSAPGERRSLRCCGRGEGAFGTWEPGRVDREGNFARAVRELGRGGSAIGGVGVGDSGAPDIQRPPSQRPLLGVKRT